MFVWEVQPCFLQGPSADIPRCLSRTFTVAGVLIFHKFPPQYLSLHYISGPVMSLFSSVSTKLRWFSGSVFFYLNLFTTMVKQMWPSFKEKNPSSAHFTHPSDTLTLITCINMKAFITNLCLFLNFSSKTTSQVYLSAQLPLCCYENLELITMIY